MKVAHKEGLKSVKCIVKTNRITFFGCLYKDKVLFPDHSKVEDLIKMESPRNKQTLQNFIGLLSFLSNHIPNLSSQVACLCDLQKKDTTFIWPYDSLKQIVAVNIGLKYYDPFDENTFTKADASGCDLRSSQVQSGTPIVFCK